MYIYNIPKKQKTAPLRAFLAQASGSVASRKTTPFADMRTPLADMRTPFADMRTPVVKMPSPIKCREGGRGGEEEGEIGWARIPSRAGSLPSVFDRCVCVCVRVCVCM